MRATLLIATAAIYHEVLPAHGLPAQHEVQRTRMRSLASYPTSCSQVKQTCDFSNSCGSSSTGLNPPDNNKWTRYFFRQGLTILAEGTADMIPLVGGYISGIFGAALPLLWTNPGQTAPCKISDQKCLWASVSTYAKDLMHWEIVGQEADNIKGQVEGYRNSLNTMQSEFRESTTCTCGDQFTEQWLSFVQKNPTAEAGDEASTAAPERDPWASTVATEPEREAKANLLIDVAEAAAQVVANTLQAEQEADATAAEGVAAEAAAAEPPKTTCECLAEGMPGAITALAQSLNDLSIDMENNRVTVFKVEGGALPPNASAYLGQYANLNLVVDQLAFTLTYAGVTDADSVMDGLPDQRGQYIKLAQTMHFYDTIVNTVAPNIVKTRLGAIQTEWPTSKHWQGRVYPGGSGVDMWNPTIFAGFQKVPEMPSVRFSDNFPSCKRSWTLTAGYGTVGDWFTGDGYYTMPCPGLVSKAEGCQGEYVEKIKSDVRTYLTNSFIEPVQSWTRLFNHIRVPQGEFNDGRWNDGLPRPPFSVPEPKI